MGMRAVLLRHINNQKSNNALEQLRLLFAYCDGENPAIPNRLIIMTAATQSHNEREFHEELKSHWVKEHDFIDALMSRISGLTLHVEKGQQPIC